MFKKIAVVLRGHVRTWHYINQSVFKNYSNISESVDYYFVTWYFPELDSDKIINSFRGQNLKKFVSVIPKKQYYNGGNGPSYLVNHVLDDIMSENYDAVIDTRPDILPVFTEKFSLEIKEKLVWAVWDNKPTEIGIGNGGIGIDDTIQMMTKNTFEIYCRKHKLSDKHLTLRRNVELNKLYHISWHVELKKYYNLSNNIQTRGISDEKIQGWHAWYIVRPNMLEHFPKDGNFLKHPKNLWKIWSSWEYLPLYERQLLTSKYNILPYDYEYNRILPPKEQ